MSRDIAIYAKQKRPVSIEEILKELHRRGLSVVWKQVSPSGRPKDTDWRAGYFLAEGETDEYRRIDLSNLQLIELFRKDIAENMTQTEYREDILSAEVKYMVSVTSQIDSRGEKMRVNLAQIVARAGHGIIEDFDENRFYAAGEYEQVRAELLVSD